MVPRDAVGDNAATQLRYGPHPAPVARGDGELVAGTRRPPDSHTTPSPSPSRMNGYAIRGTHPGRAHGCPGSRARKGGPAGLEHRVTAHSGRVGLGVGAHEPGRVDHRRHARRQLEDEPDGRALLRLRDRRARRRRTVPVGDPGRCRGSSLEPVGPTVGK